MLLLLYNIGIHLYQFLIVISQNFNAKAKLWVKGRKNIFEKISGEVDSSQPSIWFHFASLGEFEQGRPVLERVKDSYPAHKLIITFFSPSGYVLRKNYSKADHVFYLPLDTPKNAAKFISLINPELAVFTKYEYWYHYLNELHAKKVPLIIISGIFRKSQAFFKWYGALNRKMLGFVNHFFVQDENSKTLLNGIDITNVTVSGDTRFDRVAENSGNPTQFVEIKLFCGDSEVLVAGSTWPDDEKLIATLFKKYTGWKFIIAPHEIKSEKIISLMGMAGEHEIIRYSELKQLESLYNTQYRILIIDNIGMLSSLYQYADITYIGGGFGVGIHNTLEAAAFGVPVIFGPNYDKFLEAKALVKLGAGFPINNAAELNAVMLKLENENSREQAGVIAKNYVQQQKGATEIIMSHLNKTIRK